MSDADVIGFFLMGVVVIVSFIAMSSQQEKLQDPENTEVVYIDQIQQISNLSSDGSFRLRTYRQSGNLQKEDQHFESSADAIKRACATFKRAKIEYAVVVRNDESILSVRRPYHDHRGSNEGKKVGSFEIRAMV